ncbi:MAG: hypothetical protein ACI31S_00675 [Bacilli bacterium]
MTKEELYKIIELLIKSNLSEDSNDRLEILKEISISLNRIANELEISNELTEIQMKRNGIPSSGIRDKIRSRRP